MKLGTRGSALALAQARWVAERLGGEVEIVEVVTSGDRGEAVGDKARWVTELESALLTGDIDVAVHSAKDVPGELPEGLGIVAATARADARDALVGADSLDALAEGARVGTSSLRRRAQLLAARPDLGISDVRGNVDTRLRKLEAGEWDAIVLAAAGLERLGLGERIGTLLDPGVFVPAPGQGILALEARTQQTGSDPVRCATVDDADAGVCLRAERALAAALGATCNTPVGAHARFTADETLELTAFAGLPDGSEWVRDRMEGAAGDPEALGRAAAERLAAMGAADLLRRAEQVSA